MVISDVEDDPVTTANTAINKSMILMDKDFKSTPKTSKSRKSITINTDVSIQAASTPIQNVKNPRKSILKKPDESKINEHDLTNQTIIKSPVTIRSWLNNDDDDMNGEISNKSLKRPLNIDELLVNDNLDSEDSPATYSLDDLSEEDELWIMEIPKTVDVKQLIGQSLTFDKKTSLKFDKKKYRASCEVVDQPMTFVFPTKTTKNHYKNRSMSPSGIITVRRKLASGEGQATAEDME